MPKITRKHDIIAAVFLCGPSDLDPGVRRDDVSSLYPCTWESVQQA